ERVATLGHEDLTVFGVGEDLSEAEWRGVVRQLLAQRLLAADPEYSTLSLTPDSRAVLRGEREVQLRREAPRKARARTRASRDAVVGELGPEAAARFEALRTWRAGAAKEQGVPAYVVFHDATLREIAQRDPQHAHELAGISGIGAAKLERYGAGVAAALAELREGR